MNNYREKLTSLLWRLLPAAAIGAFGWFLLASANDGRAAIPGAFFGTACLVTAAIIIAPPIARILAEPAGNLFYPSRRFDRPQPVYSTGEAKRKNGLYQEAFDHFAGIAAEFPNELKPYVEMMDIAIVDMKNRALADKVFQQGMAALTNEDNRNGLRTMHKAISSRFSDDTH